MSVYSNRDSILNVIKRSNVIGMKILILDFNNETTCVQDSPSLKKLNINSCGGYVGNKNP